MVVLVACKNEKDSITNEGARVFTTLYINFSDAQGQITPESLVVSGRISNSFKLSCKNEDDSIKMKELEWSQHFPHYKFMESMEIFPDAQGQLTPQSIVRSGRISNSFEMLWLSSLPESMKKIRSKMKALDCLPHYTSIFQTLKGR